MSTSGLTGRGTPEERPDPVPEDRPADLRPDLRPELRPDLRPDLRAVMLAVMAWAGGLGGFLLPGWLLVALFAGCGAVLLIRGWRGRSVLLGLTWLVAALAVAVTAVLRVQGLEHSAVSRLAAEDVFVTATVRVSTDPKLRQGEYETFVILRARTLEVTGRGTTTTSRVPVLVIADESWRDVQLGSVLEVRAQAQPAQGHDLAAVLTTSRSPLIRSPPGEVLDSAAAIRAGIRRAVSGAEGAERTLVPALVVGDDRDMPAEVTADFQVTGLTHLLAVSGTNLTLVVGFLLILARWVGVRARGLLVVGILGVAGFVLLARTEPSVVRAAAMGSVALIGMGSGGRERGVRALGVAVWVLLLLDPWMALSIGFALSALATAGILFIAPPCRDALQRWLPRWLAEAVAVPLAAQLACTPLVAAISDQVSLVAVLANMLVAPAVGPATVLGLTGGFVVLVVEPLGELIGRAAGWCGWWIIVVAERSAELPTAAVGWPSGPTSLVVLTVLCIVLGWVLPAVLSRRRWALPLAVALLVLVVRPLPTPGWPPAGWVLVMCDVGQGDALVLNAGRGSVVVVDTGPDPVPLDRCLDRLGVRDVHTAVLTHFHADHVGGLPALWEERPPGELLVTGLAEPASTAAAIRQQAAEAGVVLRVPAQGEVRRAGTITWQVLGPSPQLVSGAMTAEGSPANNASLVLLVETHGVRILLPGDVEPEAQQVLDESFPTLQVDVLKVPHHGSAYQDLDLLTGLGARLALVPVGVDNDYGHPSGEVLTALERSGALVARTDLSGDVAVVVDGGQLTVRELSTASSAMR